MTIYIEYLLKSESGDLVGAEVIINGDSQTTLSVKSLVDLYKDQSTSFCNAVLVETKNVKNPVYFRAKRGKLKERVISNYVRECKHEDSRVPGEVYSEGIQRRCVPAGLQKSSRPCERAESERGTVIRHGERHSSAETGRHSRGVSSGRSSCTAGSVRVINGAELDLNRLSLTSPTEFERNFREAWNTDKNISKLCVDIHSVDDYKDMKCFSFGNDCFVAIEKNGNICSVFKNSKNTQIRRFSKTALIKAVQNGGDRLDCYDVGGALPNLYCACGFEPIVKIRFNEDFAPDGWDYEKLGKPDIVFFALRTDSGYYRSIDEYYGKYKCYNEYDVPYITDLKEFKGINKEDEYEEAMNYRDEIILKRQRSLKGKVRNLLNKGLNKWL